MIQKRISNKDFTSVRPVFRSNCRGRPKALNEEQLVQVFLLRVQGRPIRYIADKFGVSRMAIWRALYAKEHNANKYDTPILGSE